jgi:hypothetical protein
MKKALIANLVLLIVVVVCPAAAPSYQSKSTEKSSASSNAGNKGPALSGPAASMDRKLDGMEANAAKNPPRRMSTELTEAEINAYVNSPAIELPAGVSNPHLTGSDGKVTGTAKVDFDQLKAGRSSSNPLLGLFSGTHDVQVQVHGIGTNGKANVDVDSVEIDGVGVPRMALSFFIDHYLKPKYPGIGMHSTFHMPARVDTAVVGNHVLTLVQK